MPEPNDFDNIDGPPLEEQKPTTCFIEGDLSQAEPRIVAILARDEELLAKFESGYDVHTETASECFGVPKEEVTKAIRFCGKKGRNGANYDEGKKTLSVKINSDAKRFHINIQVSEYKAGKILDAIHQMSPNIRGVFHRDIAEALQKSRYLINPYGTPRLFMDRFGDDLLREGYAQIPQSTVGDHIKTAALFLRQTYREKYGEKPHIILEAHDALVIRERFDRKEDAAKLLKKALERPIDFTNCTLSRGTLKTKADLQISYTNYKDFQEFHIE